MPRVAREEANLTTLDSEPQAGSPKTRAELRERLSLSNPDSSVVEANPYNGFRIPCSLEQSTNRIAKVLLEAGISNSDQNCRNSKRTRTNLGSEPRSSLEPSTPRVVRATNV